MEEVEKLPDADEIMKLPISYEEKGRKEGKREVALEMLKKDLDVKLISEVTGLGIGEIKRLNER
jgi:predicted transposase YdaD